MADAPRDARTWQLAAKWVGALLVFGGFAFLAYEAVLLSRYVSTCGLMLYLLFVASQIVGNAVVAFWVSAGRGGGTG